MKKIMFVLLIVVVFAGLMAHSQPQYQITEKYSIHTGQELYKLCGPSGSNCAIVKDAKAVKGKGIAPKAGMYCEWDGVKYFDCGCKYLKLEALVNPN